MILTDLWLTNYRSHKKLHIKLKSGVTGIIGANGTGKSSIIEALQFLLTGELFHGTKEEAINLDATSGSVAGAFILNDKKGRIERHLDTSKVILSYDGEEKKLSKEVKELWDNLLQLNPEIIKKVIIARQGQIPLLFSGDETVREKIFQKIFLVPATEKHRALLWKDYIKQAPPAYPEEDLDVLRQSVKQSIKDVVTLEQAVSELQLLTDEEVLSVREKLAHLNRCVDEAGKAHILDQARTELVHEKEGVLQKLSHIDAKLSLIKPEQLEHFKTLRTTLLQQRGLFERKQKIEKDLATLQIPFTNEEYKSVIEKSDQLSESIRQQEDALLLAEHNLETVTTKLDNLVSVKELALCPTCGQAIKDCTASMRELLQTQLSTRTAIDQYVKTLTQLKTDFAENKELEIEWRVTNDRIQQLNLSLSGYRDVTFDQNQLDKITQVIAGYEDYVVEKTATMSKISEIDKRITQLSHEMSQLAHYFGGPPLEVAREYCSKQLERNTEDQRKWKQLSIDIKVKEAERKSLSDRIKNSEENHEKNKRRNEYVLTLNKVYDVFHSSQFPRKLIQSYSDIVTDYLQDNLQLFNIPYTARVADNFKIELVDDQDRVLPAVSGGQEIQVGISLHLALHDLFSQSFPLMIIDEGTTHLDAVNRKAYFDIIRSLKTKNKLKQIIIIDHDPQLSEVVDQCIELKNE